jgi:trans-aconitate 2-methyltransferase
MTDIWSAQQYLKFANERTIPALDLIKRIDVSNPQHIFDLGCGAGNITLLMQQRWPRAKIMGIDSSEDMLNKARALSSQIEWVHTDLQTWQPQFQADIVFSNATLQWINNHQNILPQLLGLVAPDGVLAIEMPNNYLAPSHLAIKETVESGKWREQLNPFLRYRYAEGKLIGPVAAPQFYYEIFSPITKKLDIWQTEYFHWLEGDNPIVEWVMGTGLRPILNALNLVDQNEFIQNYTARVQHYYPKDSTGKTCFAFKRLFIIAQK